jgi:hypothetical protein
MKHVLKIAAAAAALTIGSALPAMAQITDSLAFTTSFPLLRRKYKDAGWRLQNH